jgi:hypothetical protein
LTNHCLIKIAINFAKLKKIGYTVECLNPIFFMNPFNITDIFNSIVALNSETLEAFYDSLYENFQLLKKEKDIDNLKVLRNRIV